MNALAPESVPSPCRDVCRVDAAGICIGCGRSLLEIEEWPRAGRERRLQICAAARARMPTGSESAQGSELLDRRSR